ncbi:hypothetical protein [Gallaecimonas pentaromativorans]|uniref:Uncharacterized protein n=1 Tax=Gallaecimonas pentaromativorans TaxID=584787 RepID=A0A3N1P6R0_9GAMM|nr:hypothetical protein [Gallaecimonas pentaromativorans]ROQ23368.1 hypothetical protein EDC28_108106 [Gallaecimonas pentaromativorans]
MRDFIKIFILIFMLFSNMVFSQELFLVNKHDYISLYRFISYSVDGAMYNGESEGDYCIYDSTLFYSYDGKIYPKQKKVISKGQCSDKEKINGYIYENKSKLPQNVAISKVDFFIDEINNFKNCSDVCKTNIKGKSFIISEINVRADDTLEAFIIADGVLISAIKDSKIHWFKVLR